MCGGLLVPLGSFRCAGAQGLGAPPLGGLRAAITQ